jgi:hypothetical protein
LSIKYDYHIQVLLGKDQYLQARPDYCHGWGAEDTGDVDQSRLGRRLLLHLCGRCLFSSSSGGFCAPLSSRGLALHLHQELFYSGGWAATSFSCLPHRVPDAFVALLNRLGRWHLLQARKLRHQHATSRHKYSTTFFKMAYLSGCGLRDLQLLGNALAGHIARLPRRRGQASLQTSWLILNERYVRQARAAEPRPQLEAVLQRLFIVLLIGRVFDDNCVVSLADFAPLLGLGLPLL